MPNGIHRSAEEWAEIKLFFEMISETLETFAASHNLLIDKYYHDAADWTFRFAHPLGGSAQVQVMRIEANSVWLALSWSIGDYDTFTLSVRHETWKDISPDPKNLSALLDKALRTILKWKLGEWTTIAGGYENSWSRYTKREWEQLNARYPFPK